MLRELITYDTDVEPEEAITDEEAGSNEDEKG
jgi:hypothetical protein